MLIVVLMAAGIYTSVVRRRSDRIKLAMKDAVIEREQQELKYLRCVANPMNICAWP